MSIVMSDQHTLVVGLGKTGLSCVRYLSARGVSVAVADSREAPPCLGDLQKGWPDVPVYLGAFDSKLFAGFSELIVSPGVSIAEPAIARAVEQGARIRGDIDLFAEAAEAPVIAITGSNGKTTVTTLLGDMARTAGRNVAVGGNIGTPALDLLDLDADLYVLELSSFQLETTTGLNAAAATVLNISDDHLDRYRDKNAYLHAKQRVFQGCQTAIVNLDDALSMPPERNGLQLLYFGFECMAPETFSTRRDDEGLWLTFGEDNILNVAELALVGWHNTSNVMAALALGHAAGLPMEAMLAAARRFRGLAHRCEYVRTLAGVDYINDSKGTNVGATVAAIKSLAPDGAGKIVLIAGGEGKDADFSELAAPVRSGCRAVVLIGRDARSIARAIGSGLPVYLAESLAAAVRKAAGVALSGDRVLFSPACASFDMFRDYLDRGDQFRAQVQALGEVA
ncbi:UDP-N-acetylmuramoyl-L-alanine--D-glutamate ligase [Marinobacter adhaerens]|uniref:UDP-N-acetylmuramoylalanine--D-glutamate ligase n=1 Tax=Marinobacter adhaerens TaxID=1033846 RepID=A0A851I2P6_9GAMM|nr:UDP-N-acetylmuramoyl-L-alanine--D-glutamate ligase [Marinobacter adhaerens]NWN92411.1 UDP-N-acetylmuramoyl-L-alanine--D-glutamate ligase [Marinobacter adhaerens]